MIGFYGIKGYPAMLHDRIHTRGFKGTHDLYKEAMVLLRSVLMHKAASISFS
ncbi:hypothetical protein BPUM_3282 [Bacillus pumilus SAFR-032]|uniref:Uncharacterized protein n=1 Tax=Bacillus pumilus (strain SAFR-032) TaxID=315750 RepID=A8FI68_BACP2|nr:hypothetical protein BPUM_3282 [Bacillus pumilus SAFR-032]